MCESSALLLNHYNTCEGVSLKRCGFGISASLSCGSVDKLLSWCVDLSFVREEMRGASLTRAAFVLQRSLGAALAASVGNEPRNALLFTHHSPTIAPAHADTLPYSAHFSPASRKCVSVVRHLVQFDQLYFQY